MDCWIQKHGVCPEDALASLLEEYRTGDYLAAAFFTGRFQGCRGNRLDSVLAEARDLVELRVFNESRELWLHRSCCGRPFFWRLAGESGCDPRRDHFRTVQALDIDETYDAYQRGETDEYGSLKLRSTVKGHYALPIDRGDACVKVVNYVRYDENGVAEAADYRLAGFASMRDGAAWKEDKGGMDGAVSDQPL